MWTMTDLEEMKKVIVGALRDEEMASSIRYETEAYAKLWPFVFMVNDWDVWNESKRALRLQVVRWLERNGASWDFYQPLAGWGLVGFKDLKAATHFKMRWSGQGRVMSASVGDWNPHPLKSTFEPHPPGEVSPRERHSKQAAR